MTTLVTTLSSLSPMQLALTTGAIGAGMGSGMMFVFSAGTLQGLARLSEAEAIRAMQAINVAVINPLFLGVFMGTGLYLAVLAGLNWFGSAPTNPWLVLAALVYGGGVVAVTVGGNVPLNDALAAVDASAVAPGTWEAYARPWLRYNHLRALCGAAASGLLVLAAQS